MKHASHDRVDEKDSSDKLPNAQDSTEKEELPIAG